MKSCFTHWRIKASIFRQEVPAPATRRKPSATLSAMGMSKDQIESTVRLSFCEENTMEEADYFLDTMKELVPMLRRYSRK